MSKTTLTAKTTATAKTASTTLASRIRPAATKPVKTTLFDIRRAVHKSLKEYSAATGA